MKKSDAGPALPAAKPERPEVGFGPKLPKNPPPCYPTAQRTLPARKELGSFIVAPIGGGATKTKGTIAQPRAPGSYGGWTGQGGA